MSSRAVGEIEDEEPLKVQRDYTDGPDRLQTAYSFFLLRQRAMTPAVIKDAMAQWEGARGWPSWSLSNHDVIRFPTRLADSDLQRTKLMMALLLSLRGTAFIYQGDELGLPHADVSFERLRDPEAIAFWPSGIGRDGARTPMPWSSTANMAGFTSAADAWLPLDPRDAAQAGMRKRCVISRSHELRMIGEGWGGDRTLWVGRTRTLALRVRGAAVERRGGETCRWRFWESRRQTR